MGWHGYPFSVRFDYISKLSVTCTRGLPIIGRNSPCLIGVVNDNKQSMADRRATVSQPHWSHRWREHAFPHGSFHYSRRRLKTLLAAEDIPRLGTRMDMHFGVGAWGHYGEIRHDFIQTSLGQRTRG